MQGVVLGHWIYLIGIGGLVLLRHASFLKQARGTLSPEMQMLPAFLAMVALGDYGLSIWIERNLRARAAGRQSTVPIITAALGVSIAIYGMIAWLLGASSGWFWLFAALAAVHWFHSAVRWQNW